MRIGIVVFSAFAAVCVGCGDAPSEADGTADATGDLADPCQAAIDHLAACDADVAAEVGDACDAAVARTILDLDCAALADANDPKSDGFRASVARFSCDAGLYRHCQVPVCAADADEALLTPASAPAPAPEGASDCAVDALAYEGCGACEYYACREREANCGPEGYLLKFGYRYCNRYRLAAEQHASPAGQAWLRNIRRCLIEVIDRDVRGGNCESMWQRGFDSHPECYTSTGICDLPISDWLLTINTIDPGDLDFKLMLLTGNQCLKEWFGDANGPNQEIPLAP